MTRTSEQNMLCTSHTNLLTPRRMEASKISQLWDALRGCHQEDLAPRLVGHGIRSIDDIVRHLDLLVGDGIRQWQLELPPNFPVGGGACPRAIGASCPVSGQACIADTRSGGSSPKQQKEIIGRTGCRHAVSIIQPIDGIQGQDISGNMCGLGDITMASHTYQGPMCSGFLKMGGYRRECGSVLFPSH